MNERYYGSGEGHGYNPEMQPRTYSVEEYAVEDIQKILDRQADGEEISVGDIELVNEWMKLHGYNQSPVESE